MRRTLTGCRRIIAVLARLVPRFRRQEWVREWLAELCHEAERMRRWEKTGFRQRARLLWRCCGAAADAATLRWFQIEERNMIQDVRYALRMLARAPAFTIVVVITLAIGVGANTAIFSLVNTVLLRPLAYPAGEELVILRGTDEARGIERGNLSLPDIADLRERTQTLSGLAAFDEESFNISGEGDPVRERGAYVGHGFFGVLGVEPLLGRTFLPQEDRPGGPGVVILNETARRRYFGESGDVLGARLLIDGRPHEVVGVVVDGAELPDLANIWVPLGLDPAESSRDSHWLKAVGRRHSGVSMAEAQAEMDGIALGLAQAYPASNRGRSVRLYDVREARSAGFDQVSVLLMGFVAFLLLLACLNVANLLLSRATDRQRELAVRSAIGAGRWRLVRQLLAESAVLAAAGGAAGLVLGVWSLELMLRLAPSPLPTWMVFELDGRVVAFTLGALCLSIVVFGLLPSLKASHPDLASALKETGRSGGSSPSHRMRRGLVAAQVAISLALLVGAGLMVRSFLKLSAQDPGFSTEGVLTMRTELPRARFGDDSGRLEFYRQVLEQTEALPGVESAAFVSRPPLRGGTDARLVWLEGQTREEFERNPWIVTYSVSAGYFRTAGVRLLSGRGFSGSDGGEGPGEVLVNGAVADRFWPGEEPLGKRVSLGEDWLTVVGVTDPVRHNALEDEGGYQMYLQLASSPPSSATLFVRTAADPSAQAGPVQQVIRRVDPQQPVYDVLTTRQIVEESIWEWKLIATLLWVFGSVAVLLASVGVYGLVAFLVAQRTREVGIRMALGASRGSVYGLMLRQMAFMIGIGILAGLVFGVGVSQAMSGMLFDVGPFDPTTFGGVTLIVALVALAAAALPARRAVRVDPLNALRAD